MLLGSCKLLNKSKKTINQRLGKIELLLTQTAIDYGTKNCRISMAKFGQTSSIKMLRCKSASLLLRSLVEDGIMKLFWLYWLGLS